MHQKHKGAHSEIRAAIWLLEQGYEVFRNISDRGEADLVAIKDGVVRRFDVKSSYRGGCPTPGVEHIFPMADGSFRIMGQRQKRPPLYRELTPRELILRRLSTSAVVEET